MLTRSDITKVSRLQPVFQKFAQAYVLDSFVIGPRDQGAAGR